MSQVKDSDNPTSLILAETLLGLDSIFLGGELQQFLGNPLTLQIWLMERLGTKLASALLGKLSSILPSFPN